MKPIHITIGILLMLGVIVLANIVVYEAFIHIFNFSSYLIEPMLVVLSLGFIIAILVGMRHYNIFSRTLYIITSIWFGFFIYLFFASLLYFFITIISGRNYILIGEILIFVPVLFGIYGVFNARKIFIRTIKIKLSNLPPEWKDKKAAWISDVHIGLVYRKDHVQKIVEKINKLSPDILFIGGDLFDGIFLSSVIDFADPLKEITTPLGVYFVSGNHEKYGNNDLFNKKIKSLGIKILQNEKQLINGLQLIGIEYSKITRNKYELAKILKNLNIDRNKPSILIKHEPKDLDIAEKAGISLQISGHTHNAQQWPLNYYARFIYKKFTYGLKRHGEMQVFTSSGAGTWGPPIRVGSKSEIVEFVFT